MEKTQFTMSQAKEGYFLNAAARGLSEHTLSDYENTINKFIAFVGEDTPISQITVGQVTEFMGSFPDLSKKTRLNYHTGLSALWKWAIGEKLTAENVVRAIQAPKPEVRKIVPFTEAELKLMLGALEKSKPYSRPGKKISDHSIPGADRNRAILLLLLDTGMRATELCDIKIKDVNNRNHRIMVMGKGAKERQVQFSARTGQAIWPNYQPNDSLFTTHDGQPMDKDSLRHLIDRIGERAKVDDVHPHRFRHTFAIQYLRNGGDPYTLQMLLGHSTMEMVRRYLAIAQADLEAAHRKASPVDNWRL
jgi:site-specific recombinase XerD